MFKRIKYLLYRLKIRRMLKAQAIKRQSLFVNPANSVQKRLLIVKLDSIGDYILFRNFIKEIKTSEKYRDYEITLCGNLWWKDLSEALDGDHIADFIWTDYLRLEDYNYNIAISEQLFERKFDVAFTPTFSRCAYTDELMLQSGAKAKIAPKGDTANIAADLKHKNDLRYSELIDIDETLDFEFERNKRIFRKLLQKEPGLAAPFIINKAVRSSKIIICPGAKEVKRQWAPANFYKVALFLKHSVKDAEFYICGSKNESALAQAIIASGNAVNFTDLCGAINLNELKDLIAGSSLVLCNDSAPYHLAASLDVPLVCISNGNHYQRFCPYPAAYQKKNLEIFPSSLKAGELTPIKIKDLQLHGSALNINEITAEMVIEKITASSFLQ